MRRFTELISARSVWCVSVALLVFAGILLGEPAVTDPDLYGNLRFGLDNLHAGGVVQVDPYSYLTTGQRWINHEWLSEFFFAVAYTSGGVFRKCSGKAGWRNFQRIFAGKRPGWSP
jgi:hypothetical protein